MATYRDLTAQEAQDLFCLGCHFTSKWDGKWETYCIHRKHEDHVAPLQWLVNIDKDTMPFRVEVE